MARDINRTVACVVFGRKAARGIFEAKGCAGTITLTEQELAAILAVVGDRVTEAFLEAADDEQGRGLPQ